MWEELVKVAVTLFVVIDPMGTLPLFLSITRDSTEILRRRIARRAVIVSFGVLVGFLFAGGTLLSGLGIEIPSFRIAGGIVMFIFALQMVFDTQNRHKEGSPEEGHDMAVYPLAIPAISGPGSMMTVVLMAEQYGSSLLMNLAIAGIIGLILFATWLMLRYAGVIQSLIGSTGASIISRVMGLILAAMAIQTVLTGIKTVFGWIPVA
ncbi:MAG: MarC family protein [Gemmataceae bacterium]|nr:MarC family protein [Planctomycetota bacterium]RLT19891.1 MAG: MarC family protein [Planctomycetota bacterium]